MLHEGIFHRDLTNKKIWFERDDMVEDSTESYAIFFNVYPGLGTSMYEVYEKSLNAAGEVISIDTTLTATAPDFIP